MIPVHRMKREVRKMNKRIIAVILAGLMAACALAACNNSEDTTESSGTIVLNSADESSEEKTESKEENSKQESKTESKEESKEESKAESSEESEEESSEESVEESEEESSEPSEEPSEEESEEDSAPAESSEEAPVYSSGFGEADISFVYNNAYIAPNDNMSEVTAKIGKASSVQSAPSCIGVGEDKIYNYGSFTVESYPAPEGEKVLNIMITDAGVSTPKGAAVGMSAADVKEIYGEPTEGDDYFLTYKVDDKRHLDFIMDGSSVIEIDYVYNVN